MDIVTARKPARSAVEWVAILYPSKHRGCSSPEAPHDDAHSFDLDGVLGLRSIVPIDLPELMGLLSRLPSPGIDDQAYVQLMERANEAPCGGLGEIEGDVNRDCRVDFEDFCTLGTNWLQDWSI